jgi:hypothetical protein
MPDELDTAPSSPEVSEKPSDVPAPEAPVTEEEEEAKPEPEVEPTRPRSGFAREKIKRAAAERRAEEAERHIAELNARLAKVTAESLIEPQPESFNDWKDYQAAVRDYNKKATTAIAEEVINSKLQHFERRLSDERQQQMRDESTAEMQQDWNEFAKEVPDAEPAVRNLLQEIGGSFHPRMQEEIRSITDPEIRNSIFYYLGRNVQVGAALNDMAQDNPRAMIRELAKLEERARLPQSKKSTTAPPPINAPRGGAAAPKDPYSLAKKDDATDYIRMRMAEMKKEST